MALAQLFDDAEATAAVGPGYMTAYSLIENIMVRARLSGASEIDLASALWNHQAQVVAELDIGEDHLREIAALFVDHTLKLRHHFPEVMQGPMHDAA